MLEIIDLSAVKVQAGGDVVLLPPKKYKLYIVYSTVTSTNGYKRLKSNPNSKPL